MTVSGAMPEVGPTNAAIEVGVLGVTCPTELVATDTVAGVVVFVVGGFVVVVLFSEPKS